MFHIVLHEPEIPPNTGNVLRLAANAGARLHLVRPLGFTLQDRELNRAGLGYGDLEAVTIHADWASCVAGFPGQRIFAVTKRGTCRYDTAVYRPGDVFVFGSETRGLPESILTTLPDAQRIRVPMRPGNRSLNLSNTVALVVFEAWRQNDFAGGG